MFSDSVVAHGVTRICGHRETLQVSYKYAREKAQILHNASHDFCPSCKAEISAWFEEPATSTFPITLPPLVGSEKQVKWASGIRDERFKTLRSVMEKAASSSGKSGLGIWRAITAFSMQTSARFWIDGRDIAFGSSYFMTEASYFLRPTTIGATFGVTSVFGQWKARAPRLIDQLKARAPFALERGEAAV